MDAAVVAQQFERLRKRRNEVAMALQHLNNEQRQDDHNTDWLDQAGVESRINFLDRLNEWYRKEIGEIDDALDRIRLNRYGLCSACHEPIEEHRLETAPEAQFCVSCQRMREDLEKV